MSIAVRFAPSPTGKLHLGSLRPALINFLYARKHNGRFWLRMDDTDEERSTAEFAASIEHDLGWLGLPWDHFARQSDRMKEYDDAANKLRASGRLYPAYETPEELSLKRKARLSQGLPPIYDRAALSLTAEQIERYQAEGRKPHWRFKLVPGAIEWPDLVHGMLRFDAATLTDPVVIREDGRPLFTMSGVIDDAEFAITHIIRGDDHITNTAVQIQIFGALGAPIPVFAHLPLLLDAEGDKLSKRIGSLTIEELRNDGIEAMALVSVLARLGSSESIEPFIHLEDLLPSFDLSKFGRAAARFDGEELKRVNAKILHRLDFIEIQPRLTARGLADLDKNFWNAVRGNLTKFSDIDTWWQVAQGPISPIIEDTAFIQSALQVLPADPWSEATWESWTKTLKDQSGRNGKALFLPLRQALTGQPHGPEMRVLLPLIGRERALARLEGQTA